MTLENIKTLESYKNARIKSYFDDTVYAIEDLDDSVAVKDIRSEYYASEIYTFQVLIDDEEQFLERISKKLGKKVKV